MRLPAIVVLVSVLAAAPSAMAAESADVPTLAVPKAKAAATLDPAAAEAVASAIAAEARRFPVKPVAGADLAALCGAEKAGALVGCAEATCLSGLAADFLISSELSEAGDQWVLAVDLLFVKHAKSMLKTTRKAPKSASLAELAADAAAEVLMAIGEPTSPRPAPQAAAPEPVPAPAAEPVSAKPAVQASAEPAPRPAPAAAPATAPAVSAEPSTAQTAPPQPAPEAAVHAAAKPTLTDSDRRLGGYVLDGVGAVTLLGGLVSGVLAMTSWDAAKTAKTVADYESALDRGKKATAAADALYGIGGAVVAVGLLMTFFPPSQPAAAPASAPGTRPAPPAPVTVGPTFLPGGAGLFVSGGF